MSGARAYDNPDNKKTIRKLIGYIDQLELAESLKTSDKLPNSGGRAKSSEVLGNVSSFV